MRILAVDLICVTDQALELGFTVRDTGIGMSADQLGRLFIPFAQADSSMSRRYGGSGLGLTISRQLVELMGGALAIESEVGKGTVCRFTARFGRAPDHVLPLPLEARDFRRYRALVVDDLEAARTSLKATLAMFDVTASDVVGGAEAVAELVRAEQAGEAPFDVVLLDWRMPNMNGFETARAIKSDPRLKSRPVIIMVTAFGRDEALRQSESLGLEGFLVKPVTASTLLDTLHAVLGTGYRAPRDNAPRGQQPIDRRLAGCRILLVEDYPINQQIAREILEKAGAIVDVAGNGEVAVARLAETATALEEAIRSGADALYSTLAQELSVQLDEVVTTIRGFDRETMRPPPAEISSEPVDLELLAPLCRELAAELRDSSIKAARTWEQRLAPALTGRVETAKLEPLETAIRSFDYERARVELEHLRMAIGVSL